MDGIGAGLQSVAVPGRIARILNGTVNAGRGAVITEDVGASLSPAIGGRMAQSIGYPLPLQFWAASPSPITIWFLFSSTLRSACDGHATDKAL